MLILDVGDLCQIFVVFLNLFSEVDLNLLKYGALTLVD